MLKILNDIQLFDLKTFNWCMSCRYQQRLTGIAKFVSRSADGYYYLLLIPILWGLNLSPVLLVLLVTFGIERSVYFVLKQSCRRDRPEQAIADFNSFIQPADKFSFPSGHTSAAFLVAAFLSFLQPTLSPLFYLWASSVGLSRIFLGVHFPTDVLMGALLGSLCALTAMQYF